MDRAVSDYEVSYVDGDWEGLRRVVLIVEDHEIVRSGMRKIIADMLSGIWVEFLEASTFAEARQIICNRGNELDLILLDVNLPDACGGDEIECMKSDWKALPVVVVSASDDWQLATDFLKAGALGFISKSSNVDIIINALRLIFAGGRYFPPQVFDLLMGCRSPSDIIGSEIEQNADVALKSKEDAAHPVELSPRQRQVLALMLQGRSNKEIARELGVSVGTAKNYVAVVLRVYNAPSRAKAMLAALGSGAGFEVPDTPMRAP